MTVKHTPPPLKQNIPILNLTPQIDSLWDEINEAIQRVLRSGQFIMGPEVEAFEHEVATYLGIKHAIGLNSGTDALTIGLRALDIGSDDEVITTPFSFFATAESISNVGAKPVFVDIEEDSMNIDPQLIESAITPQTKAIMPVHIFGRPADMVHIFELAHKYSLKVIEDCAQSFGASYSGGEILNNRKTGTFCDVGAFSFYPTKNLGAFGDGGLLVTNNDAIATKARMLREHGANKQYHNEMLGYNSRLDSLQAALLRVKLPYIDIWNQNRKEVAQRYQELLASVQGIIPPTLTDEHIFHQYTIRFIKANRDVVKRKLQQEGISTMVYYPIPQDQLPIYRYQYQAFPSSDHLATQVLSLPLWPELELSAQTRIIQNLAHILESLN